MLQSLKSMSDHFATFRSKVLKPFLLCSSFLLLQNQSTGYVYFNNIFMRVTSDNDGSTLEKEHLLVVSKLTTLKPQFRNNPLFPSNLQMYHLSLLEQTPVFPRVSRKYSWMEPNREEGEGIGLDGCG